MMAVIRMGMSLVMNRGPTMQIRMLSSSIRNFYQVAQSEVSRFSLF